MNPMNRKFFIHVMVLFSILMLLLPGESNAGLKVLSMQSGTGDQDCSCTSPGLFCSATAQAGFVTGEICASRFDPAPSDYPLQLTKVYVIFGPTGAPESFFDLTIWKDDGTSLDPIVPSLYTNVYDVIPNETSCYVIDLSSVFPPVCLTDPTKKIRVGFTYDHDGVPGNMNDSYLDYPAHNYIYANLGFSFAWFYSTTLGVAGDWIMELEIDTNSTTCGGSTPTVTFTPTIDLSTPTPTYTITSTISLSTTTPTTTPTLVSTSTFTMTPTMTATFTPSLPTTPIPTSTPTKTFTFTNTGAVPTPTPTPSYTSTISPSPTGTVPFALIYFDKTDYYTDLDSALIKVEDPNLNKNPSTRETGTITVNSSTDIIGFPMVVKETGINTGIFTSFEGGADLTFSIVASNPTTSTIHVSDGDMVVASYFDSTHGATRYDSVTWHQFTPTSTPTPPPSYVSFNSKDYCTVSDEAIITVFDPDVNTDPLSKQTITVHVISNSDIIGIDMLLTEESLNSSYFTSAATGTNLKFDKTNSLEPFGIIKVSDGDIVGVSYIDTSPPGIRNDTSHWWDSLTPCAPPVLDLLEDPGKYMLFFSIIVVLILFSRFSKYFD